MPLFKNLVICRPFHGKPDKNSATGLFCENKKWCTNLNQSIVSLYMSGKKIAFANFRKFKVCE